MTSWHQESLRMRMVSTCTLTFPCAVSAGAGKGRRWTTVRSWSYQHTTSIAQEGGTTTGSTWTWNGERRQAGPIMEFALALQWYCRQRRVGFLTPRAIHVPHAMRSEASSSCPSARTSSKLFNKRWRDWTWAGCVERSGASSGKHLARSWKAARSANEASPALFILKEMYFPECTR